MMTIRLAAPPPASQAELRALADPVAALEDANHHAIGLSEAQGGKDGPGLDLIDWVQHRILTMGFVVPVGAQPGDLIQAQPLYLVSQATPIPPKTDVKVYAASIVGLPAQPPFLPGGRLDIDLPKLDGAASENHARWLVLELDPKVGWMFTVGTLGVSAKGDHPGEDFDLYFVDDNGHVTGPRVLAPPNCRVAFWTVMFRRDQGNHECPRDFTYHVTIPNPMGPPSVNEIDPSIPNTGGGTIP